jgi:hypothetical protein
MKITELRTGKDYVYADWGNHLDYEQMVQKMCDRLNLDRYELGIIKEARVGYSEYPTNEIWFESGMMIFDERTCQLWTAKSNENKLREYGYLSPL